MGAATSLSEKLGVADLLSLNADALEAGKAAELLETLANVLGRANAEYHTNDAPSSITRLVNIGLEPFLVGAAVNAVLAQRLLRRLCKECKEEQAPSEDLHEVLQSHGMETDKMWVPVGCDRCRNTGYSGRVGIYEMLTINDELRDIVARNPNVSEFRKICIDRGMISLRADGMGKVKQGLTSVEEVFRVTESGT